MLITKVLDPSGWIVVVVEAMFLFVSKTRRCGEFGESGGSSHGAGLFCDPSALKSAKSVDLLFSLESPTLHICSAILLFFFTFANRATQPTPAPESSRAPREAKPVIQEPAEDGARAQVIS